MLFNCNDYFTSAIIILKPKQTVRIKQNYIYNKLDNNINS